MIGSKLGHYRITAPLGAGGMGEVYRARDERLGREVAIKVLPRAVADDPERMARFEREARALAALSHPNILAIFDFGADGGITYAVTELLEGETLRHRLERERLPWRKSVETAAAVADGLAAAHGKGIIHRDIKPDNIFITTDGRVKVLDFGLARVAEAARAAEGTPTLTDPGTAAGTVMGTVGYMAPEQVRGQSADARSDIFTLGCLLYEMLAGKRAFARETSAETMAAILKDPAPEVSVSGVEVTPELNRIVSHCLEKNPGERFQSASDLSFHLKSLLTGTASARSEAGKPEAAAKPETPSIAVLPFANLSPDPDQEYFCDGMTEEIIADLSKVRSIRVTSRTSAMRFKGTAKGVPEIARDLNVRHVLEGTVRRSGNNLRITAQLIDAGTDAHLWSEKYTGSLDDVFSLQEQLSRRIVEALKVTLTTDEERRLLGRHVPDVRARDAWLRARHEFFSSTSEGVDRAVHVIEQALRILGDDALLHAGMGVVLAFAYDVGIRHDEESLRRAESSAARALELDPDQSQAWFAKGYARLKRGDVQGFVRDAKRAVELEPSGETLAVLGLMLLEVGKTREARRYLDEALARDPMTFITSLFPAVADLFEGQHEPAFRKIRDAVSRLAPGEPFALWWLAQSAAYAGLDDEARVQFKIVAGMGASPFSEWSELFLCALDRDRNGVRRWFASAGALLDIAMTDEYFPCYYAACLAMVDEFDESLRWLEQAVSWWYSNHEFLSRHNRFLAPLRDDPRFKVLMDKAREKERAFEV